MKMKIDISRKIVTFVFCDTSKIESLLESRPTLSNMRAYYFKSDPLYNLEGNRQV